MTEIVALDFPVLDEDGAGFADGIRYEVAATISGARCGQPRMLTVEHRLTGVSFVRDWIVSGDARFSTRLLFRNGARREAWLFDGSWDESPDTLSAKQGIPIRYLETPEVFPGIVTTNDRQLIVNHPGSGLTDLWQEGERIDIPRHARIGRHAKLSFDDDSLISLIHVFPDTELGKGEMKTVVREHAREDEKPVILYCASDVYDELRAFTETTPSTSRDAMRSAILTQALCAIYSYMQMSCNNGDGHDDDEEGAINRILLAHGRHLKEKTDMFWDEDDFNPSLAATKMRPYAILKTDDTEDED